jgi:C-terminal processing protease CtpA/Prc
VQTSVNAACQKNKKAWFLVLYVLLNNGTLSQAEIFTLKLKQLNNVTTLGSTTKGMLAMEAIMAKESDCPAENWKSTLLT